MEEYQHLWYPDMVMFIWIRAMEVPSAVTMALGQLMSGLILSSCEKTPMAPQICEWISLQEAKITY